MTESQMKEFAISISRAFEALDGADPVAIQEAVASIPVGLRDTARFNLNIDVLTTAEVQETRRALTRAISLEKWIDGFVMAMRLVAAIAGVFI